MKTANAPEQHAFSKARGKTRVVQLESQHPAMKAAPYDGAELRPFEGRPGSMDAFNLPSRMGAHLVYRKDSQQGTNQ